MNYKLIGHIMSPLLLLEAIFMIPAIFISLYYNEILSIKALIETILIICIVSLPLYFITKKSELSFNAKDGLVLTGIAWILMSLAGALPFWLSGEVKNYIDCLFETVSGFTTTGSSILTDVESLSKGLLYWRSFTHWIGGMGVLVFLLAVVPLAGKNQGYTLHILRAESPGPSVGKLVPKMKKTASILYLIYVVMTIINIIFLLAGGIPKLEAFCIAFGTAGTGGFGIKADSMNSYSPYIQNVTTFFMAAFGVNFSCYYLLLLKRFKDVFKDEELRLYIGFIVGSIILITIDVMHAGCFNNISIALRNVAFSVSSVITTTGYGTADFNLWPSFSKTILLFLMFSGACAGSTGGGIKVSRIILLLKSAKRNLMQMIRPNSVSKIRVNGTSIDEKIITNVNAYLIVYVAIIMISLFIISLDGFDFETNFSAIMATFNNIGPGLGLVGPAGNFYAYSNLSKIVMIIDMLAGRLEIIPILCLFNRRTWTK